MTTTSEPHEPTCICGHEFDDHDEELACLQLSDGESCPCFYYEPDEPLDDEEDES